MVSAKVFAFFVLLVCQALSFSAQAAREASTQEELRRANAHPVHMFVGYKQQFTSITAAIDAVPVNNTQRHILHIQPGHYREKVTISKDYVTLEGRDRKTTVIVFNRRAADVSGDTIQTATVAVESRFFVAKGLTFMNDAPKAVNGKPGQQAVALRLSGDLAAIYDCAMISSQDTLYDHQGRHYITRSRIEGNIDFIFGQGRSLYEKCDIISTNGKGQTGAITAQSRSSSTSGPSGFVFVGCYVGGTGNVFLGRPWKDRAFVVFANSYLESVVDDRGWSYWNGNPNVSHVFYGEYNNSGPGSNTKARVGWSRQLKYTPKEINHLTTKRYVNGDFWA